jgi:hypothetical protein
MLRIGNNADECPFTETQIVAAPYQMAVAKDARVFYM